MGQKIRCLECGDVIESLSRHHMKFCRCKAIFIDGGDDYTRIGWNAGSEFEYVEDE